MKKYLLLILLSMVNVCSYSQNVINAGFVYPIKPGDTKWKEMNSVEDRVAALQIPETILTEISTESLLDICLDYPYLLDVLFYDDYQKGIEGLKSNFNGFNELLNRKDIGRFILTKDKDFSLELDRIKDKNDIEKGRFSFRCFVLGLILAQDNVIASLTKDEEDELLEITNRNMDLKNKHTDIFSRLNMIPSYLLYAKKALNDSNFKFTDTTQKNKVIEFVNRPISVDDSIIECMDNFIKKQNEIKIHE